MAWTIHHVLEGDLDRGISVYPDAEGGAAATMSKLATTLTDNGWVVTLDSPGVALVAERTDFILRAWHDGEVGGTVVEIESADIGAGS